MPLGGELWAARVPAEFCYPRLIRRCGATFCFAGLFFGPILDQSRVGTRRELDQTDESAEETDLAQPLSGFSPVC